MAEPAHRGRATGAVSWLAPEDAGEAADLLRARGRGRATLFTGAPAPAPDPTPSAADSVADADFDVLSTASLASVPAYEPRDQVVTVGAGLRLAALRDLLAEEAQWLPSAAPRGSGPTTVGGMVAAARATPFDHAYGPLRRQLLACRVAAHDGRLFRWGRPVVKNVAGYDIQKLCCGSHGRLGVILEASFRVWPVPPAARAFRVAAGDDGAAGDDAAPSAPSGAYPGAASGHDHRALDAVTRVPASEWFAPDAVRWRSGEGLRVLLAGTPESVSARQRRLTRWAEGQGLDVSPVAGGLEAMTAPAEAGSASAGARGGLEPERALVRLSTGPTALATLTRAAAGAMADADARLEAHPLQGVLLCQYRRGAEPEARIGRLLDAAAEAGARARVERGGAPEHAAAAARRPTRPRELEERLLEALGGRPRDWRSDHV